jgi:hypothetical protein
MDALDWRFSKIIEPFLPLTNRNFTNIKLLKKKRKKKKPGQRTYSKLPVLL